MYQGVIIYAPAGTVMDQLVHRLENSVDKERFKMKSILADQASIPDLAAADLFLLGSLPEGRESIHPDFSEILRALAGVTLAGRTAGVFTVNSQPTLTAFRTALQDCELVLGDTNFRNLTGTESDTSVIMEWLGELNRQLESIRGGR
jgi:hypothetical protein